MEDKRLNDLIELKEDTKRLTDIITLLQENLKLEKQRLLNALDIEHQKNEDLRRENIKLKWSINGESYQIEKQIAQDVLQDLFDMAKEQGKHPVETPVNWVENIKKEAKKYGVGVQ